MSQVHRAQDLFRIGKSPEPLLMRTRVISAAGCRAENAWLQPHQVLGSGFLISPLALAVFAQH